MRYRRELADFGAYFLDSIKGIQELVLYSAGEARAAEVDRRSDAMLGRTKALKRETAISTAATETAVSLAVLAVLTVGIFLVRGGSLSVGRMVLGVTAVFGSFGPVIAVSALPANLNQTFASGERILSLLEEKPEVEAVERGTELSLRGLGGTRFILRLWRGGGAQGCFHDRPQKTRSSASWGKAAAESPRC